jgi:hypothetical protein
VSAKPPEYAIQLISTSQTFVAHSLFCWARESRANQAIRKDSFPVQYWPCCRWQAINIVDHEGERGGET